MPETAEDTTDMRLVIALTVLAAASVAAFFLWPKINTLLPKPGQPAACTAEAKLCPDGSSVGRTLPSCAFAACPGISADYKNGTYIIEGQPITLLGGISELPAAHGSASKIMTRYFGNDAMGDLNGDTTPDVAFILTQDSGGSGTFYYVVAALKTSDGYQGTNAVLLGDRVAPQTTEIKSGELIVNYADRKASEPLTAAPSVGVSKYLQVQGTMLTEVQPVE